MSERPGKPIDIIGESATIGSGAAPILYGVDRKFGKHLVASLDNLTGACGSLQGYLRSVADFVRIAKEYAKQRGKKLIGTPVVCDHKVIWPYADDPNGVDQVGVPKIDGPVFPATGTFVRSRAAALR